MVMVSNSAILEQVCLVTKEFDKRGGATTYLVPDQPEYFRGTIEEIYVTLQTLN